MEIQIQKHLSKSVKLDGAPSLLQEREKKEIRAKLVRLEYSPAANKVSIHRLLMNPG